MDPSLTPRNRVTFTKSLYLARYSAHTLRDPPMNTLTIFALRAGVVRPLGSQPSDAHRGLVPPLFMWGGVYSRGDFMPINCSSNAHCDISDHHFFPRVLLHNCRLCLEEMHHNLASTTRGSYPAARTYPLDLYGYGLRHE